MALLGAGDPTATESPSTGGAGVMRAARSDVVDGSRRNCSADRLRGRPRLETRAEGLLHAVLELVRIAGGRALEVAPALRKVAELEVADRQRFERDEVEQS